MEKTFENPTRNAMQVTSAVLLADDLESCDQAAAQLREQWPKAAVAPWWHQEGKGFV